MRGEDAGGGGAEEVPKWCEEGRKRGRDRGRRDVTVVKIESKKREGGAQKQWKRGGGGAVEETREDTGRG
jgi:hypothetical protein